MPAAPPEPPSRTRSRCAPACLGCGATVAVVLLVLFVASRLASATLERRAARLHAEIRIQRASPDAERPPLLFTGQSASEGNAADDYAAIEWILGPTPGRLIAPPDAGATGLAHDHPRTSGVEPMPGRPAELETLLDSKDAPSGTAATALKVYGPLARHVRAGIRRTRCDWGLDLFKGLRTTGPDFTAHRAVAYCMAFEAREQPPLEAACTGLEVVAYGRDIARHGTTIGALTGAMVQRIGVRTIARAAGRAEATSDDLEVMESVLGSVRPLDLDRAFEAEWRGLAIELLRFSGHPVDPADPATPGDAARVLALAAEGRVPAAVTWIGPLFYERELATHDRVMEASRALMARPAPERAGAHAELLAGLSTHPYVAFALVDLGRAQGLIDAANVEVQLARVVVAAQRHARATPATPVDAGALAARLGGHLPPDPFAPGATVRFAFDPQDRALLRAWSLGFDFTDQGGVGSFGQESGDIVLTTRLAGYPPGARRGIRGRRGIALLGCR